MLRLVWLLVIGATGKCGVPARMDVGKHDALTHAIFPAKNYAPIAPPPSKHSDYGIKRCTRGDYHQHGGGHRIRWCRAGRSTFWFLGPEFEGLRGRDNRTLDANGSKGCMKIAVHHHLARNRCSPAPLASCMPSVPHPARNPRNRSHLAHWETLQHFCLKPGSAILRST